MVRFGFQSFHFSRSPPHLFTYIICLRRQTYSCLIPPHVTGSSEETLPEVALCSASITPQTLGPLRWAGPGRSTYWFFWWEKGVGHQACQHADQQVSDCRHSRSARGRSQMCNCVPCPGRALPTADSPSGRGGCHQETDCAGRWKIEASYTQMTAGEATNQILKCKQFKGKVICEKLDIQPGIKLLLCSHVLSKMHLQTIIL